MSLYILVHQTVMRMNFWAVLLVAASYMQDFYYSFAFEFAFYGGLGLACAAPAGCLDVLEANHSPVFVLAVI
jgi:hypothetical protein